MPSVSPVRLETQFDLESNLGELARMEPRFGDALAITGMMNLRQSPSGFPALARTIIGQQVSVASANAIWARFCDARWDDPKTHAQMTEQKLRDCGLSAQKIRYVTALAEAKLDYPAFFTQDDETVRHSLTQIIGIGDWTAQIYMMFALGRADVFAPADLALQEATRILFTLGSRPNTREMEKIAQDWSPYRNAAAHLLWAYYHAIKDREGIGTIKTDKDMQ